VPIASVALRPGASRQEKPLVSVVIPSYNHGRFLPEAIDSVRGQTHGNVEVVVVDDGSSDDTVAVAGRLGVRCVSQPNRGCAAARNTGLGATTGDFVVFLDADDRLLPHALEANLDAFDEHPEAALVSGSYVFVTADGRRASRTLSLRTPTDYRDDHYAALLRVNFLGPPAALMYRRAPLVEAGGFRPSLKHAEDYDLSLRLAHDHPIFFHGALVAEYRRHCGNKSRHGAVMLDSVMEVLRAQRSAARRDPSHRAAYVSGVRFYRHRYGEPAVEGVSIALRDGDWRGAATGALTLARWYRRGLLLALARAIRGRAGAGDGPTVIHV
jgi:glycosyltransferase involved in cell wall biosynthesis